MIALLFVLLLVPAQVPQAPSAAQTRGTCEIRGRVTDKEGGRPIARAVVRLTMFGRTDVHVARTDDEGRYQITALPPGEYRGFVEAGDFRATHLAASLAQPSRIVLKDGEVRTDVNVVLARALAMTVRVVDEWGGPLAGLRISASTVDGRRAVPPSMLRLTDDRGRLRLFKLPPGRYVVCAEASGIDSAGGADSPLRERFLRTCYPSAAAEAQAEPVQLEGSDVEDLEIRMRRGRTFSISGMVLDASGTAATSASVNFTEFERRGSSSRGVKVGPDGGFTVTNVVPGEYAIEASLGGPDRPEQRHALEAAYQPVRVESSDVDAVIISMVPAVDVAGRITVEDPAVPLPPRPPGFGPLFIYARVAGDRLPNAGSARSGHPGDDGVFVLDRMFGRRRLQIFNVPRGWYVKSIRYDGRDVIDVPTEFKASRDPSGLEVILSSRGAIVSGRVVDERGEPARGARALLLPAEPARWMTELTSTPVSATGAYRLGPQRGGDYFVVAVDRSTTIPDPDDRDRLTRLIESAERITLVDDEERTLELRVVKPGGER